MEYLLFILKCILLRLTSTVVTSIVWHVLRSVERSIFPEFAAYQIITSLKYGSLKGSGVNSLDRSIWKEIDPIYP